jgi:hypothetical protein
MVQVLLVTSWIMSHKHKRWPFEWSTDAAWYVPIHMFQTTQQSRVMFSQNQGQMWCITISSKRGGNIKGPHFAFGVDSWIFGVSKGYHVEPFEGTSKLVEFISTFWTSRTFADLMISCSDQANTFSFNLQHRGQIVQKNIKVSQIIRFSVRLPLNRSTPRTTMALLYSHSKQPSICYIWRRCWRHVIDLNHPLMVVSIESSYMQKLSYIPNLFRSDKHCFSWLIS